MTERIDELEEGIRWILEDDVVPVSTHREAVAKLNEHEELRAKLKRPEPFRKFLSSYLQDQRRQFADGERAEPLCRCGHAACELKRGSLPGLVRRAESLHHGIDEYQDRHPEAVILVEAREEWSRMHADYRSTLRDVKLLLREGLDETAGSATG